MSLGKAIRVGLVGAGHISEFHARAVQTIPNARIVGITDVVSSRAADMATRFRVPNTFENIEAMIREGVDVVHVLTPPHTHAELAITALQAGCDVLVEKPLAMNVEQVDAIAAAASRAGRSVCVNHSLLYDRFVSKALRLVRSGVIGTPLTFDYFRSSDYPPYCGGPLPIHYRDGGYPFLDQGIHALYLAEAFLGEIEDARAYYSTHGGDSNLLFDEWRVGAKCQRGTANIQISWNVRPLQSWFVVQGTKGVLRVNLFSMWLTCSRKLPLPRAAARPLQALSEGASICAQVSANIARFACKQIVQYDGLRSLITAFYHSLQTNAPVPVSPQEARSTVYWTERVSREADGAKNSFQAQFSIPSQSKVLVTGATGLIGRHLVRRLLQQGIRPRILVRRQPPPEFTKDGNVDVFLGDLGDPNAVDRAVAGTEIVYHLGAAMSGSAVDHQRGTVCGTQNIVESVLRHDVQRLIYMSSLSCLRAAAATPGAFATESWAVEPYPEKRGSYTQAKTSAEKIVLDAVRERKLRAVLLRPGRVFGPKTSLLTPEVARRIKNSLVVLGDGTRELPLVYVEDVIDAILLAAEKGGSTGSIYHVVDPTSLTQNQLIRKYLSQDSKTRIVHVPEPIVYALAFGLEVLGKILKVSPPLSVYRVRSALARLRFDCSRAQEEIGWKPRVGIACGLRETIAVESAPLITTTVATPALDT